MQRCSRIALVRKKYTFYKKYSSFEEGRVLWEKSFVEGTESIFSGCQHFFSYSSINFALYFSISNNSAL